MDRPEIESILESSEIFRGLEKRNLSKIAGLCQSETYEAGDYLFRQGDSGEHLFIIVEGQVFLERAVDLDTRKGNVMIAMLGRGRALGCWSALLDQPHNLMSSAICKKPTKALVLKGSALREMMLENRELGFNVLERLCFLLRDRIQGAYGALEKI